LVQEAHDPEPRISCATYSFRRRFQRLQRKTAIFQLMPSVKFESNGGSGYDHECSYCDAVSFNGARLHELSPILIIALQLKY
jgi:hypothetical protein